jgi:hypothetical protein
MSSPVEKAVATYVRASNERDPALRAQLIEQCFAADGRMLTRSGEIRGRAGILEMLARVHADPRLLRVRLLSAIDAGHTTFRFRGAVELRDGTLLESLDTGEIDADGRISLILTFAGPLANASTLGGGPST